MYKKLIYEIFKKAAVLNDNVIYNYNQCQIQDNEDFPVNADDNEKEDLVENIIAEHNKEKPIHSDTSKDTNENLKEVISTYEVLKALDKL